MVWLQIVVIILVIGVIIKLLMRWQGEAKFIFKVQEHSPWKIDSFQSDRVCLSTELPFENCGRQDGTLVDVFPRVQLADEQFDSLRVGARLYWTEKPRADDYWECMIFPRNFNGKIKLLVEMVAKVNDLTTAVIGVPNIPIDIYYQAVSRSDYYIAKTRITLTKQEIAELLKC